MHFPAIGLSIALPVPAFPAKRQGGLQNCVNEGQVALTYDGEYLSLPSHSLYPDAESCADRKNAVEAC